MKKLFLIFLVLLIACPAWSATKTVCGSGCDYTTIALAEAGATAGDTINVSAGTYNENNPTFTKALTWIASDGNGTVTITNSGTGAYAATFTGNNAAISITGFVFDGLNVKASGLSFAANAQNKTCDYCTFQNGVNLITYGAGTAITITNSTFGGTHEYVFFGSGNLTATDNTFTLTTGTTFGYVTGGTVTFTNNNVSCEFSIGQALWDLNGAGITLTSSGNTIALSGASQRIINGTRASSGGSVTMSDTITSSATYSSKGFYFTAPGWTLDFNNMEVTITNADYTGSLFNFINQINPKIRNSKITMIAPTATNAYCPISIGSTGTDGTNGGTVPAATILNNKIYSNNKSGYIIAIGSENSSAGDSKLDNILLAGNNLYGYAYYNPDADDGSTHAIFYGHSKNGLIFDNYVNGGGYGIVLKGSPTVWTSGGVFYNRVVNSENYPALLLKGVQGVRVYNNTLSGSTSYLVSIHENGSGQEAINNTLKNNIMVNSINKMVIIDNDALTGFVSDNNLYFNTGDGTLVFVVEATEKNITEWKALGYDADSVNADPLFISNGVNFHLQSGSPARGAGVDVGLSNTNPPDIGAEPYKQYVPWNK